jgi:hypothetical protein
MKKMVLRSLVSLAVVFVIGTAAPAPVAADRIDPAALEAKASALYGSLAALGDEWRGSLGSDLGGLLAR